MIPERFERSTHALEGFIQKIMYPFICQINNVALFFWKDTQKEIYSLLLVCLSDPVASDPAIANLTIFDVNDIDSFYIESFI